MQVCRLNSSARDGFAVERVNGANSASELLGGNASRLGHIQVTGMPRGCLLASRSAHAGGETDSARRMFVRPPTAIGPIRCRAQCFASPAKARCAGHADPDGLPQHHNRDRLTRSEDDSADALVLPVRTGWNQQVLVLAVNRSYWPQ
jgi:hypothetical protein